MSFTPGDVEAVGEGVALSRLVTIQRARPCFGVRGLVVLSERGTGGTLAQHDFTNLNKVACQHDNPQS